MKLFENIVTEERSLRGISDENLAMNEAFIYKPEDSDDDLETLLDKYADCNPSIEGEGWDNFKHGQIKVKDNTSKFFHGLVKAGKATASTVKTIGQRIGSFVSSLKNSIQDKIVTEKYIHEKFDKIESTLEASRNMRCYVKDVPTYETMISRLNALLACANFIKDLSAKPDVEDTHIIMEQLAVKSKGVVRVAAKDPKNKSSFANLEWKEAELSSFDIKASKYGDPKALATLKNLILHCKYDAIDDLMTAGNMIDKKSHNKAEEESSSNSYDEEPMDEDSKEAGNYALVYTVGKVVKQFYKEGIQKELNMIATVYCTRLTKYTDK